MHDFYVHNISPYVIRFSDSFAIHWYGLAYVLSFYFCYLVMRFLARRGLSELKEDKIADFITMVAIFGVVIGGRIGFVLLYGMEDFFAAPLETLKLWKGGMSSHGGIAGVFLFTLWYARRHRISWAGLGDTLVCGAPLGLLLGRTANFINGELYGRATDVAWAMKFPTEMVGRLPENLRHSPEILEFARQTPGGEAEFIASLTPRHPSQIYEALGEGLLLFLVLLLTRLRFPKLPHGILTAMFFIFYAVIRIALENYREPDSELIFGVTKGQFYSLFMIAIGLAFLINALVRRKEKREVADDDLPPA